MENEEFLISNRAKDSIEDKILLSALAHFIKDGYHDTSVMIIAKEAGITKASVYYYFSSKHELAAAALKKLNLFYEENLFNPVKSQLNSREKVKHFINLIEPILQNEEFSLMVIQSLYQENSLKIRLAVIHIIEQWINFLSDILKPLHNEFSDFLSKIGFTLIMGIVFQSKLNMKDKNNCDLKKSLKFLWLENTYFN